MSDSRTADKYVLRMPDGLRAQVAAVAKAQHRSMNSEIINRLERSFDTTDLCALQSQLILQLSDRIKELENASKN
jgi:hypothetical protein